MKLNDPIDNSNGNYCGIEQEPLLIQQHPSYTHNSADIHLMLQSHQLPSGPSDEIDGAQAADYFYAKKPPPQMIPTNYENINLCNSLYATHPSNSNSESTLSLTNQFDQRYAVKELPAGLRTSVTNSLISENFNAPDADPLNVNYQSYHLPRSPQCFITSNNRTEHNPIDHHQHQNGYVMHHMQLQHSINQPEHYHVQRVIDPIYYAKNNQPQTAVEGVYAKEPTWPSRIPATNNGLAKLTPHIETISNRTPSIMKPPPYTYAKAFTRMTPNDLMLYESFRNKTLSNGDASDVPNDHENGYNGYNDDNENGMQLSPTNGTDSNQNQEADTDDAVEDVEGVIDENVDDDQNHMNTRNFGTRNDIGSGNVAKNVRSGKPWMFGVHKNPKVVSLK